MEQNRDTIDGDWYSGMCSCSSILETGILLIKQTFDRAKMILDVKLKSEYIYIYKVKLKVNMSNSLAFTSLKVRDFGF